MALPLSSADYPEVRAALDVTLDSTMLPDSVIALDAFAGAAYRELLARDPDAATRTGDEGAAARLAAVYLAAARLAPVVPTIVSESFRETRYQRQAVDPAEQAARLRGQAEEALATYLAASTPFFFRTVAGCRGR